MALSTSDKLNLYFSLTPASEKNGNDYSEIRINHEELSRHPYIEVNYSHLKGLHLDSPEEIAIDRILFLDVECIELGFGVNNIPYLIGLGHFQKGKLHFSQIFSESPLQEESSLAFLDQFWSRFDVIVTFNGKSFDIPLLQSRFALLKKNHHASFARHFDIYRIIRQVYDFDRNRLIDAEKNLFDYERKEDLPGVYSGQAYFEYMKHGDKTLLNQIISHNREDVLSMVALSLELEHQFTLARQMISGKNPGQKLRAQKIYKHILFIKAPGIIEHILRQKENPDAEDEYFLGRYYKKNRIFRKAVLAFCRSYRLGNKKALFEAIMVLNHYLKKLILAKLLVEYALPLEEAKNQLKLLKIRERLAKKD